MTNSKIPIQNIYYLLCYAWDKLEEGKKINLAASDYDDSIHLFGRVLVNGCNHLFKRGLDKSYLETSEEYIGIKGKINFKDSLNKNLFKQGKAFCIFDKFESDILSNQIIKATLLRITKIKSLEKELKREVWNCFYKFNEVSNIELYLSLFSKIRIHRNNSFYDFIIRICKLIVENTVLDEKTGKYTFKEFIGSDKAMANLFESFIRNFYKKEQNIYIVSREDILWDAISINNSNYNYLPKMQTDISLESPSRKIIIETKYYTNALISRFDTEKLNSNNLYQLYSYLRNIEPKQNHTLNPVCEGILLYPSVNYNLSEEFLIGSHHLRIKTIDLNTDWVQIRKSLLDLL